MNVAKSLIGNPFIALTSGVVFLLAVLNRGAAEIGFSLIRMADFGLLFFSLWFVISPKKIRKTDAPGVFLVIGIVTYHTILFFVNGGNFSTESLRFIGSYVYILYFIAGVSYYKNFGLNYVINFMSLTFRFVIIFGALKPIIVVTLYDLISIRGVSLFGIYGSYYSILVPSIGYFIVFRWREKHWKIFVTLGIVALLITGSRSGFLSFFALIFLISFFVRLRYILIGSLLMLIIFLVSINYIIPQILAIFEITQRGDLSLEFYSAMFRSIFDPSYGAEQYGESLSGSRSHRLKMWQYVINNVHATDLTAWFGVGFSSQLVDARFINPHNSYITFLGRGGYLGLFAVLTLIVHSMWVAISASIWCKKILRNKIFITQHEFSLSLWAAAFISSEIVSLCFSTVFESPMNAVPMFFLLGVSYSHCREVLSLKRGVEINNISVLLKSN